MAKRTSSRPGEATAERILDTAERLFGERGVDATSVREITDLAEVNTAAIHYHFHSKESLVQAIFARRMTEVSARRAALVESLSSSEQVGVQDVAKVVVQPLAELVADPEDPRRHYLAFLASASLRPGSVREAALASFASQVESLAGLMERALPGYSRQVRMMRFMAGMEICVLMLADLDFAGLPWDNAGLQVSRSELIEMVQEVVAGVLAGPPEERLKS